MQINLLSNFLSICCFPDLNQSTFELSFNFQSTFELASYFFKFRSTLQQAHAVAPDDKFAGMAVQARVG